MAEETNRPTTPLIQLTSEPITPETPDKTEYSLRELLSLEIEEEPCLFSPIFTRSGIAVLVGGSDSGKSTLLRQMCMCVASGRDFLGWRYGGEHNRAIYFSSEDDEKLTARVVKKYNNTMQIPPECTDNLKFEFDIDPETIATKLESLLIEEPADLIIIDALGDAFNGKNLNDNREVRAFYNQFKPITKKYNCLIIFNHHTGKRTSTFAPNKDNTLGSQAIEAAPRLAIELRTDPENHDLKHFCITKCNYLGNDYKTKSFALEMDENLVFSSTGERIEFDDLAKELKKQTRKPATPNKYDDETHKEFLIGTFEGVQGGVINQTRLRNKIEQEFELSDKKARNFVDYYEEKHWIEISGKGIKNSTLYKCNL